MLPAIEQFQEILRLDPGFEPAKQNLSMLLAMKDKTNKTSR